jgi:hypothetical protein
VPPLARLSYPACYVATGTNFSVLRAYCMTITPNDDNEFAVILAATRVTGSVHFDVMAPHPDALFTLRLAKHLRRDFVRLFVWRIISF